MSFDPDAFLAQPTPAAASPTPQPSTEGFDPDAFIQQVDAEKYGTVGQQAKAVAEGVARGVLGPAAPALEKQYLGVKKEDIAGREAANPVKAGVGEAAGLVGGTLTGVGEGALMSKVGEGVAAAAHLAEPLSYAAKIGSSAVQQAAEMAVLQSGDEVSKRILQDEPGSAQTAIANIGLAAALGGAGGAFMTGAISPLWKATVGDKLEGALTNLSSRLGGQETPPSVASDLVAKSGVEMPPEIAAKINGSEMANRYDSKLSQSDSTIAGRSYQKTRGEYMNALGDKAMETLGNEPDYISKIGDINKYGTGQKMVDELKDELSEKAEPIFNEYDKINDKFKDAVVSPANQDTIREGIAKLALDQGWSKAAEGDQMALMESVLKKLPEQTSAKDLKNFVTSLRKSNVYGSKNFGAAKDMSKVIEEGLGRSVTDAIASKGGGGAEAEAALEGYRGLKARYADLMNSFDALNEHLHVGRYDGPKTFLKALDKLGTTKGETALNRLAGTNRAQILELLAKDAPETLDKVRQYHVDRLLKSAAEGDKINPTKLIKNLNNEKQFSPQIKDLIATPEMRSRLQAIGDITEKMKDPTYNWTNTARTISKNEHGATTPLELLATMLGHGGAAVLSHLGRLGFSEGADGARLGLMKFLGSEQPVKASGFKSMVNFMNNTYKGENLLSKGVSGIFKRGAQVIPEHLMPTHKDREKLDKIVSKMQDNPNALIASQESDLGHYMPGHAAAVAQASTQAMQYLNTIKPKPYKPGPLDKEIEPTSSDKARYDRALDIAQQPGIVLQRIKDGTLQLTDLKDLNAMYPQLYPILANKITNEMVKAQSDEESIPYRTKLAMSLFLGQPLDSSMQPMSIQAAQPLPKPPQSPQQPAVKTHKGTTSLGKSNKTYQTASQQAEADRTARD